ncbi:MAG: NUDIX pyrophosphatase [Candidatus Marinimicrobia bacterium]|nr:NUDIX pyrophosphatase [Candidatus Neomarinimicrobiota bacterium]
MTDLKYIDVFPFARMHNELRFLLLHRSINNSYPGIWQPVSGKLESGEKAWQAGLRELREETGFSPLAFFALDHVSTYYLHHTDELIQVPAFLAEVSLADPILSHEHDAFQWLALDQAISLASWEPYRQALAIIPKLLDSSPALSLARISLKK